jgi:hypothetical protein
MPAATRRRHRGRRMALLHRFNPAEHGTLVVPVTDLDEVVAA